jgi:hypothetical protein
VDGIVEAADNHLAAESLLQLDVDVVTAGSIHTPAEVANDVQHLGDHPLPIVHATEDAGLCFNAYPANPSVAALATDRGVVLDADVGPCWDGPMAITANNARDTVRAEDLCESVSDIIALTCADLRDGELELDPKATAVPIECGCEHRASRIFVRDMAQIIWGMW